MCNNGHTLNIDVICSSCDKGKLFWIDLDTKHVKCNYCRRLSIISNSFKCMGCGAQCKCKLKTNVPGF